MGKIFWICGSDFLSDSSNFPPNFKNPNSPPIYCIFLFTVKGKGKRREIWKKKVRKIFWGVRNFEKNISRTILSKSIQLKYSLYTLRKWGENRKQLISIPSPILPFCHPWAHLGFHSSSLVHRWRSSHFFGSLSPLLVRVSSLLKRR